MHVSGVKTSLQGVAASKVIVLIGERNKNLQGKIEKKIIKCVYIYISTLNVYCILCLYIHDRCVFEGSVKLV